MNRLRTSLCMAFAVMIASNGGVAHEGKVQRLVPVSHGPEDEAYGGFVEPTGPALPDGSPDALVVLVDGVPWDLEGARLSIPGKALATPQDVFWWQWRWDRERTMAIWVTMDFQGGKVHSAKFDVRLVKPVVINRNEQGKPGPEPSRSKGER